MVAHRYELNGAGPSYVAHLSAQGNGSALLSPDPQKAPEVAQLRDSAARVGRTGSCTSSRRVASRGSRISATDTSSGSTAEHLGSSFLSEDSGLRQRSHHAHRSAFSAAPNPVRTENLGEETILGFRAYGTRVITTLPAGQIGNERPIDIVSEQWFSPELESVMRSVHRDPWAGEFTTTVTKVSRGDQPASLFEVPAPYRIIDSASESEHHVLDGHGSPLPAPRPGSAGKHDGERRFTQCDSAIPTRVPTSPLPAPSHRCQYCLPDWPTVSRTA